MNRKISPALFGLALICFLLPWVNFSCSGNTIVSVTGTDLAIGRTIAIPQGFGQKPKKAHAHEARATAAFAAGIAGLLSGLLIKEERFRAIASAVCGGVGAVALFLLKDKLDSEMVSRNMGMITVDYLFGFWAAMLLFLGACIVNIMELSGKFKKT